MPRTKPPFFALRPGFFLAAIPERSHPFPSRTRKLSSPGPMVLQAQACGRVGRCRGFEGSLARVGLLLFSGLANGVRPHPQALANGVRPRARFGSGDRSPGLPEAHETSRIAGEALRSGRAVPLLHWRLQRHGDACDRGWSAPAAGVHPHPHHREDQLGADQEGETEHDDLQDPQGEPERVDLGGRLRRGAAVGAGHQ